MLLLLLRLLWLLERLLELLLLMELERLLPLWPECRRFHERHVQMHVRRKEMRRKSHLRWLLLPLLQWWRRWLLLL